MAIMMATIRLGFLTLPLSENDGDYSSRKAFMGSNWAARRAGK